MARHVARRSVGTHVSTGRSGQWRRRLLMIGSGAVVVGLCIAVRGYIGTASAEAQSPAEPAPKAAKSAPDELPQTQPPKHDVMAVVNGQDIRRDALAAACVDRYGEDVLESIVNKRLIEHHCRNRNIEVTPEEIEAEVDHMAARFKIGRQQWLDMLQRERNINAQQYRRDIIWPTLALRKLAADQLTVSDQELQAAYDSQFGEAIKARLIVVEDRDLAEKLHRQLVDRPDDFARLAMQHSRDVNSASIGGLIQPIHHHVGDLAIEREVFSLKANQVSSIIPVGGQFAILKCEGRIPPRNVPLDSVRDELTEAIKEQRLRDVAGKLFKDLQDAATVQNVWNNPDLRAQMPGIVATVNGEQIRYAELAEECLARYGKDVLELEISHLLLQQALTKQKLSVTQDDLNAEIAHAAKLSGVVDEQGQPDLKQWIKLATEEQGVSRDDYLRDSVWPSAALKKLTGGTIQVTDEDLKKGFDANYGPRVRCRVIVLPNMRRAQEVWDKARQNPSMGYFGDLAAEYSIEPTSKALRGEVPPIRRYGGQPQLEDVAFELADGELSGIIQLGDSYVILKCEGRTEPVEVNLQDVQDILYQDIFEKKIRIAMNKKFDEIRDSARIDNYLAGTSQSPDRVRDKEARSGGRADAAVRPAGGATTVK
jgi:parvulin-like peptidyl-prolyl isomerase